MFERAVAAWNHSHLSSIPDGTVHCALIDEFGIIYFAAQFRFPSFSDAPRAKILRYFSRAVKDYDNGLEGIKLRHQCCLAAETKQALHFN